ncbi:EamA family transporter [Aestuarium zhoushanense]|uniref:DMT family transporter n=1 Tax=Marivivens donghaensis TaxID=1699413 RepID=UPI000CA3BE0E|nr:DMT family transporter [Marivivens donghaensis]AUJ63683.1 EamA family transporter [Aestuarium zhoushanense]MCL7407822.1 DMT family transporter [Marivivens donghaensis]MDN3704199.1 DMT family transporter [Marivivens donghaensis]
MTVSSPSQDRPVQGVLWMLATGFCFVVVNVIVRYLGEDLPAAQSAFIRFAWSFVFLVPTLGPYLRGGIGARAWQLFGLRGALHTVAIILWFFAMARIPMAEVTAIGYLNPIVVTVGAALLLGEGFARRRMLAIGVALIGALIVIRPGMREIQIGHLSQLGAALSFGLSYLVAKQLSGIAPAGVVVAMLSGVVTICLAPIAFVVWEPVELHQVMWLGGVAVFASAAHYCMTKAFASAPMTVTQPVTFLQLVWASIFGAVLFGEAVDPFVLAGGALIIGAISYMTWREAQLRRKVTPVVNQTKV